MRWKQGLLTLLLLLVAALIVAYGLGERLPAEHTTVAAATISAPQAKVWTLIADVDAQPTWRSGLKSIEDLPSDTGNPRWTEHYKGMAMSFRLIDNQPMTERVVEMEPHGEPFDGEWTFQLLPMDDGRTAVTITEHGHTYSPMYRFVMHYIFGDNYNLKKYLNDLTRAAQS